MTSKAKPAALPEQPSRPWENGARIKIIFPAPLMEGEWWRIFNTKNEMTVLARETDEARKIVDTLNSHADLVKALEGSQAMLQLLWEMLQLLLEKVDAHATRACIDEQLKINVAALKPTREAKAPPSPRQIVGARDEQAGRKSRKKTAGAFAVGARPRRSLHPA